MQLALSFELLLKLATFSFALRLPLLSLLSQLALQILLLLQQSALPVLQLPVLENRYSLLIYFLLYYLAFSVVPLGCSVPAGNGVSRVCEACCPVVYAFTAE